MERMERDGTPADLPQHRESNEAAVQSQETGQSETAENAARNQAEVQPAAQVIRTAQSSAGEEVQVQVQQVQNRLEQLGQNPERLPEQAAELERVVRSLQSRWLQIQDVVAGVQQMLHYIEDSQSALSAARGTSEEGNGGTAQASDPEASQPDLALEPAPRAPSAPSAPSVLITPSEAIPAPVTETPDMAKEEAAPLEPETVETAQASGWSDSIGRCGAVVESASSPEFAAVQICQRHLSLDQRRLRRRGFFQFQELDDKHASAVDLGERYSEHQMLYRIHPDEDVQLTATSDFEPIGWFGKGEIPFDEMPEDDPIWYERVLFDDAMLRGHFSFRGTTLVEHTMEEVSREEGLCESMQQEQNLPLLLHNPDCSKSRALKEALEARKLHFTKRHYLEDLQQISDFLKIRKLPLKLHENWLWNCELEVLLARLKACDENFASRMLCRDADVGQRDDEILEAVALQPKLMQRPALVTARKAAFGRPKPEDAIGRLLRPLQLQKRGQRQREQTGNPSHKLRRFATHIPGDDVGWVC
eukprot:symbB.v1.2.009993.t2/scaffold646.1/size176640/9